MIQCERHYQQKGPVLKTQRSLKKDDRTFHGRPKRDRKRMKDVKRELALPRR
ncbi:hypothetical protein CQ476_07 [TM7 phage DolZOral124_53_65]|nr:hypothetical protein CQ476_07 [TM7 phage DolZOral124_53_65]